MRVFSEERIRARVAVGTLFLVNGLTLASIVPWFPVLKSELDLTNAALGLAIAAGPLGGLALGTAAAALSARFGTANTATGAALVTGLGLLALGFVDSWLTLAGALALLGAADVVADAAMNSHGLRVERRYRRSVISSLHALWSVGAVIGGLIGAVAVSSELRRSLHLSVAAAALLTLVVGASRWLLRGSDEAERSSLDQNATPQGTGLIQAIRTAPFLLIGFALIPAMAAGIEDSASSWAAVHLRETVGASALVAGLGFVAAQTLMVVGRLAGDRLVDRFSARWVIRTGSLIAFVGMLGVVFGTVPAIVVAGFGLAGLGVSNHFPLGLAAAGNTPGVRSADGVTFASWLARLFFFVLPPLVGLVADAAGLRWGLSLMLGCAAASFGLAGLLSNRRRGGIG